MRISHHCFLTASNMDHQRVTQTFLVMHTFCSITGNIALHTLTLALDPHTYHNAEALNCRALCCDISTRWFLPQQEVSDPDRLSCKRKTLRIRSAAVPFL